MSSENRLQPASHEDLVELMTWFPDAAATSLWGGPKFRYPFDESSFIEDCRYTELASYCLKDRENTTIAFGQYNERYGRIHLARLVVAGDRRGQGLGAEFIAKLMIKASAEMPHQQYSLFVYRHNAPAYACYYKLGFRSTDYPQGAPLADVCYYMTRDVDHS